MVNFWRIIQSNALLRPLTHFPVRQTNSHWPAPNGFRAQTQPDTWPACLASAGQLWLGRLARPAGARGPSGGGARDTLVGCPLRSGLFCFKQPGEVGPAWPSIMRELSGAKSAQTRTAVDRSARRPRGQHQLVIVGAEWADTCRCITS